MKLCKVNKCDRFAKTKGLCKMHYGRLWKTGTIGPAHSLKRIKGTGFINSHGYKILTVSNHPNAMKRGQIAEHVLIMSNIIGRPLIKGETVHHKNGVKHDNRPENLELRTVGNHPYGQSVKDMIAFCEQYLERYGYLKNCL